MGGNRILSVQECEQIEEYLANFQSKIKSYYEQIQSSINVFNNNSIVQSFYESGNFGREMEEELLKIKEAIQRYYDTLVDGNGLIPVTGRVVASQRELLNRSYQGGR